MPSVRFGKTACGGNARAAAQAEFPATKLREEALLCKAHMRKPDCGAIFLLTLPLVRHM